MTHFLSIQDLGKDDVVRLFKLTAELKAKVKSRERISPLGGRTLALIFEKPSLRTRVTFEVGMVQLGGAAVYLSAQEIGMGKRESVPDVARNLSRWVDGITARVFSHQTLVELAQHATVPVINALSDYEHPCQAMALSVWLLGYPHVYVAAAACAAVLIVWRHHANVKRLLSGTESRLGQRASAA